MQFASDFANIKYLYDKIQLSKIIKQNFRELTQDKDFNFDEEVNIFSNLRNSIIIKQYNEIDETLLTLYKEYLFYFCTFKSKQLLKCNKLLSTNDIFEKNKKLEYEFEYEDVIILYNIGITKIYLLKIKKKSDDIKALNKISNSILEIYNYLFQNMNDNTMKNLTDVNCVSCYIFLCLTSAYHENIFYNTAISKKYKRNLLAKLSFNIYTYFNDIQSFLDGKCLDVFKDQKRFCIAKKNLQYIRNTNGHFYNFIEANKLIFLSISNYHSALKYVELNKFEEIKVNKYEEDKIGQIISRLKFSLNSVHKCISLCKKYNLNISIISLKEKILKISEFFDYENKNIYFETIPPYETLEPLKGTEVIKIRNVDISEFYKEKKISNRFKLLFKKKATNIYESYHKNAISIYEMYKKRLSEFNDQYNLIKLKCKQNIELSLNNSITTIYNRKSEICQSNTFQNNLNFLLNVEKNLIEITNEVENKLNFEHKNNLEFQKIFANVSINQDSLTIYNNFLFHLNNFKVSVEEIKTNNITFKKFLDNNYSNFQIFEMELSHFYEYIINQLNQCITVDQETLEKDYLYYKNLLYEKNENFSNITFNEKDNKNIPNDLSLNYKNFSNFIKSKNLSSALQKKTASNNSFVQYKTVNKYINLQLEEKLFFVIVSIYFLLTIQISKFSKDLNEIKGSIHDEFLNSITEENDNEKLDELLRKQKEVLDIEKSKLENHVSIVENTINNFYTYYHEYNKLDCFKIIEDINNFVNELNSTSGSLNTIYKKHLYTLKSVHLFKNDVDKYINMRENERSKIRAQHVQGYHGNYHMNNQQFY